MEEMEQIKSSLTVQVGQLEAQKAQLENVLTMNPTHTSLSGCVVQVSDKLRGVLQLTGTQVDSLEQVLTLPATCAAICSN